MSLFNTMRTAVSGMAAQSNALSTIGDNIANSGTTGYKEATAQFETLLGNGSKNNYESGGVQTDVRYGITDQGTLATTTSSTDLAISGNGFFVVNDGGNGTFMTRAGSFVPDKNGNLVNTAGYNLMGYQIGTNGTSSTLSDINVASTTLQTAASTSGTLTTNLPSTATAVAAAQFPSSNAANASYTEKTSLTVYDNLGQADVLDVYLTKTGDSTWEATAYNQKDASASGGFPYANGPVGTSNLTFDPTSGKLAAGSATTLTAAIPNGNAVAIDLSGTTQLASDFQVTAQTANGNAPSSLDHVAIGKDGTLSAVYASGFEVALYKIPLATVESPDNLTAVNGDIFQANQDSGAMVVSTAGTQGTGSIVSDALEQSKVDLATELTNMIEAQRGYEANSKVLQAGSDLLGVLNRLTTN